MIGTLTIDAGISRLDGTRLMRGALNNGGFGRATTFLRQTRGLQDGQQIFADGQDAEFDGDDVFVITDAGPATSAGLSLGGTKSRSKKTRKPKKKGSAPKSKKSAAKRSSKKR